MVLRVYNPFSRLDLESVFRGAKRSCRHLDFEVVGDFRTVFTSEYPGWGPVDLVLDVKLLCGSCKNGRNLKLFVTRYQVKVNSKNGVVST